jgi:hypothetical protein
MTIEIVDLPIKSDNFPFCPINMVIFHPFFGIFTGKTCHGAPHRPGSLLGSPGSATRRRLWRFRAQVWWSPWAMPVPLHKNDGDISDMDFLLVNL